MRIALTALAACVLAACGGATAPPDGAAVPADDGACNAAAPSVDGALEVGAPVDGPSGFCGGAVALAAVTPFGVFVPDAISAEVAPPPGAKLQVTLAEAPPSGIQLTFDVPAGASGGFVGTADLVGFLESGGAVVPIMVHVAVTSATAPLPPDAGMVTGEASMDLTIDTDCGTFSGTVVARYCGGDR
jgi:hypothetical protein